jgi:hypothetical protein
MKKMKRAWFGRHVHPPVAALIALCASATFPSSAAATQGVDVRLSTPYLHDATRSSVVRVDIENTGDEDVTLLLWDTPFAQAAGRLPKPLFEVSDASGERARYTGRWVNVGRLHAEDFVVLHPGDVRSADVDLLPEYDYGNGGAFAVRYVLSLDREPDPSVTSADQYVAFRHNTLKEVTSNDTIILVNGPVRRIAADTGDECTQEQRDTIFAASGRAFDRSYAADGHMYDRYKDVKGADGKYHPVFQPHPRYERWFGEHDDSHMPDQDGWLESDNGHAYKTTRLLWNRILGGPGRKLTPKCGCPGYPPTTPAWAEADSPYVVHFCDLFFKLPETGWPASRAGTIVHEYSHFNSGYEGTQDYVYGVRQVEELAKTDRWKAVRNADSFEFYVMDTTPYDERAADPEMTGNAVVEATDKILESH